jgi:hypothetical protein
MAHRHVTALLAAVLLAVAGCGDSGTDKEDYVKSINEVGRTLQQQLSSLGTDISSQSDPRGIASKLEDGAKTLDGAADDLDDIDPPDDATKAHEQIVAGVRQLADTFETGVKEARGGKLDALAKTFGGIGTSPGIRKIAAGTKALKDAGYKIK